MLRSFAFRIQVGKQWRARRRLQRPGPADLVMPSYGWTGISSFSESLKAAPGNTSPARRPLTRSSRRPSAEEELSPAYPGHRLRLWWTRLPGAPCNGQSSQDCDFVDVSLAACLSCIQFRRCRSRFRNSIFPSPARRAMEQTRLLLAVVTASYRPAYSTCAIFLQQVTTGYAM